MHGTTSTTLSLGLSLIALLTLSCLYSAVFEKRSNEAIAQSYVHTIRFRNLVIDLGNGIKTNAQLTYPAVGKGPFPGVLLIHGSGANDKNETLGFVHKSGPKPPVILWQIAQYLSERGFAVLRYDKRGVGTNHTILNTNVWGNSTANDLIQDSKKALNVLVQQPEVDPNRISVIGHSEATLYAPRIAIDNSTKVKNIILMGTLAQNPAVAEYNLDVSLPSEYATKVFDKNHTGLISIQQITKDPVLGWVSDSVLRTNNTKDITNTLGKTSGTKGYISIDKQLNPLLIKTYENITAFNPSKCNNIESVLYC